VNKEVNQKIESKVCTKITINVQTTKINRESDRHNSLKIVKIVIFCATGTVITLPVEEKLRFSVKIIWPQGGLFKSGAYFANVVWGVGLSRGNPANQTVFLFLQPGAYK